MFAATSFLALAMAMKLYSSTALGCLAQVRHGRGIRSQRRPRLSCPVQVLSDCSLQVLSDLSFRGAERRGICCSPALARKRFLTSFGMTTMKRAMNMKVVIETPHETG